jgi:DNA-binding MarR family transcriptional regulator
MAHQRHLLDPNLNSPVRVSIMAALVGVDDMEFGTLRDAVELSDSTLSKHLSILEVRGYVRLIKGYGGKWPRTWVRSTDAGRGAFRSHASALEEILGGASAGLTRRDAARADPPSVLGQSDPA